MPGRSKIATVREEEIDDNGIKTGWVKVAKAVIPDCELSKSLLKSKGNKVGYEILSDTINWISPEGTTISNKERIEHGGSIVSKGKKEIEVMEKLTKVLEALTAKK